MAMLSRLFAMLFVAVVILASIVAWWTFAPVSVDRQEPDPAVAYLNETSPASPPLREGYFEYNGNQLHYVIGGEGPPIVMVHGFPSYWFSFLRQADALRNSYTVILVDGLGAGKSDAPADMNSYKLEVMADHLLALVRSLGFEQAHFVGHDWGAVFAYGVAQRNPERVLSVTGISAPPQNILLELWENNEAQRQRSKYVDRFKSANPPLLVALRIPKRIGEATIDDQIEKGYLHEKEGAYFREAVLKPKRINAHINWYRANLPAIDDVHDADFWPSREARLTVPAQIIWGDDDMVAVPEFIDMLEEMSDDLTVVRFPDVAHQPHLERATEVTSAIRRLVDQSGD